MSAEGLCQKHLYRKRHNGDPQAVRLVIGRDEERFWSRVRKDGPVPAHRPELGPCWEWTGRLHSAGYGTMSIRNKPVYMHRYSYELHGKIIPVGLQIDHLCHDPDTCKVPPEKCPHRRCVNPAHLEPVTNRENTIRGNCPRVTSERCFGTTVPERQRRRAIEGRQVAAIDQEPRECERCGRTFRGNAGLGIHNALIHGEHAPRWPRSQPAPKFPKAS